MKDEDIFDGDSYGMYRNPSFGVCRYCMLTFEDMRAMDRHMLDHGVEIDWAKINEWRTRRIRSEA